MTPPPPPENAQKKFAPVRPLLNQPPLNIENLPTRIQKGECTVLPPKFYPPMCCPPTACQPCGPCGPCPPPCTPYCLPQCYYPNPCSPCQPCQPCTPSMCCPQPPPMCCPPPCQPIIVCQPPCTPCSPCMPSPPPPPCCPPPPCPPPPCQPCVPDCCGRNTCCCGPKQIICIPRRGGTAMAGGCGNGTTHAAGVAKKHEEPVSKPGIADQAASYNNCNFYLSEIPRGLRDKFGLKSSSNASPSTRDEECSEDEEECTEETEECTSGKNEDDECLDDINIAAGDDQIIHPPVGYPGSKRTTWGAGPFPGLANGHPFGTGEPDMYGMGVPGGIGGIGGRGRGMTREGRGSPRNSGDTGSRGYAGSHGRGRSANGRGTVRYTGNKSGRAPTEGLNATTMSGRDPSRRDQYGHSQGRYNTAADGDGDDYDDAHHRGGQDGRYNSTRSNYPTGKSIKTKKSHINNHPSGKGYHKSGVTSKSKLSRLPSGFRPYSYSNAELTKKSDAYLPENYDIPPPHEFNKSIHPSRAPITPYSTYNDPYEDDVASIYRDHRTKVTYAPSKATQRSLSRKQDFGHMTSYTTRSQATMKPSCSSVRNTHHAHTSTYRLGPSTTHTAVNAAPSYSNATTNYHHNPSTRTTAIGANPSSKFTSTNRPDPSTRTTGISALPSSTFHSTHRYDPSTKKSATGAVSSTKINTTVAGTGRQSDTATRAHSEPNLRRVSEEDQESSELSSKRTTQTSMEFQATSPTDVINEAYKETDGKHKNRHDDPCHPPKTCLKYHARRLHRLCSQSQQRKKRLSEIHKPKFHFKTPACPIRETVASILRKVPPGNVRVQKEKIPAFHDYCMTDHCPDTNRYPLLTRELSPLCHEHEEEHQNEQDAPSGRYVEPRGAKRKQHHR